MKRLFAYLSHHQWLPSLLALLLLAGCHNTDPTTGTTSVSGQVVAEASRQPVAGATVQVFRASAGGGYVPVGTGYPADAQGRFAFPFEATQKTGYILAASAPPRLFHRPRACPQADRRTQQRQHTHLYARPRLGQAPTR